MLTSPNKYSSGFIEAVVLHVDSLKFICSVRTVNGRMLQDVPWILPTGGHSETGMHITPNVQDTVLVSTFLGYPLILGCIPRVGMPSTEVTSVTGAAPTINLGTMANTTGGATLNPGKPTDLVPGDFSYTAKGGSSISLLTSGMAIIKASPLSQIILNKYEGLIRILARNYQRFSDSSSFTASNVKGRLYTWLGVDWSISKNIDSTERYNEVYGDVAAGEVLRGLPDPAVSLPAQDTRVVKKWLKDASGVEVMSEVITQDGSITITVGNSITKVTPSGVSVEFGTSKGTFDLSQASLESNGHFMRITSAGISMG